MGFSSSGGAKVGTIELWGGSTAPDGYLLCNGGAVSRSLYADLFAVIGTTYGAGDGSTTFNLPNGTNVVTGVNTNVPVKGNGKAIGIKLASGTVGGFTSHGDSKEVGIRTNNYDFINSKSGTTTVTWGNAISLQPDANNSGVIGTVTRSIMNCKYIIKY